MGVVGEVRLVRLVRRVCVLRTVDASAVRRMHASAAAGMHVVAVVFTAVMERSETSTGVHHLLPARVHVCCVACPPVVHPLVVGGQHVPARHT